MQNEALQRFSEFGAGMAATRSPNFFTMLGGGARAQAEGDRTRMDELRRVAEAERQARAQQAEEQFRNQQLENERLRRLNEERRINADIATGRRPNIVTMIDPETRNAVLVNAETGQVVSRTPFRPMQELRNAPRPLSQAQIANIRQQVTRLASADAGIIEGVAPTPAQITRRDELADRYFRDRLDAAAAGLLDFQGGGAGTGSAGTTTGGGPAPSQVLQYGGPAAPAAPRTGPRISAQPTQQAPQ
jgi:hypothetical protein